MNAPHSPTPPPHPLASDTALRRRLTALARGWLADTGAAEDLVQETYLRTAQRPLPGTGPAWLTTVLRHLCVDHLRRRRRYQALLTTPPATAPTTPEPAQLVEQAQQVEAALQALVATLNAAEVAAVLLREVFEFEHAELGTLLARSEVASRQYLHRLLRRLRRSAPAKPDAGSDKDAGRLLALCREALLHHDPSALIALLRASRAASFSASAVPARSLTNPAGPHPADTPRAQLLQGDGVLALLVYLDDGQIALLPLGEASALAA